MRVFVIVLALSLGFAAAACDAEKSEFDAGSMAYARHDYDAAIHHFTQTIALKPDNANAYFMRGLAYGHKGLPEQAIADLTKTLELTPGYSDAYELRGNLHEDMGKKDEAIADYRKTLSLKPGSQRATEGLKRLGAAPETAP